MWPVILLMSYIALAHRLFYSERGNRTPFNR